MACPDLRLRLIEMRAGILARLAGSESIELAWLNAIAGINAALAALDAEAAPVKRRGGDPQAQQRRQRDEDISALARLSGKGKPIEQQARDIAQRLDRYRPMSTETIPERRLMQKIKNSKLPVGQRRIRKILAEQSSALDGQNSG
jgi:hypothetical protein